MPIRTATAEEQAKCLHLYRKLTDDIDGIEIEIILNTMCFMFGEIGVDMQRSMTKKEFIDQLVEQVNSAYDTCYLGKAKTLGEA